MKVVIVLGKKPSGEELRAGIISVQFKQQLDLAINLLNPNLEDRLIISGGVTTPGYPSEAELGMRYVPICFLLETLLEEKSVSTAENISFTRDLVHNSGYKPDSVHLVSSASHLERAKLHMKRHWPEMVRHTMYHAVPEKSAADALFHRIGYWIDYFNLGGLAFAVMKMIGMKN